MFYKNIHTFSPVSSRCLNFFADIVGRIKCPAYIGCGDTPTRNTNPVNLTELEMSICFLLLLLLFNTLLFLCVCVFILVVLQEGLITAYTIHLIIALVSCLPWVCA